MLTIERMYELAQRAARSAPPHPAYDRDDLVQCAVIGMMEASVRDEALATVVARRRIIDEIRRYRGRPRAGRGQPSTRVALHEAAHLYQPLGGASGFRLADVIPADDDLLSRVDDRLDATREAPGLLRAAGRTGKHVLIWHVVQGRSMAEIAVRCGVTESRVSQIASAALARARTVHAARGRFVGTVGAGGREAGAETTTTFGRRGNTEAARLAGVGAVAGSPPASPVGYPVAPRLKPGSAREWLEATPAEKRAFGEFRRLQRAGLSRQEALAALPEAQRALAAEYQRKCQRRVRARSAGLQVAKQAPRSQKRYDSVDEIVVTPEERAAAGAVWTRMSRGERWRDAVRSLSPHQRALAESYNTKMRARSRVRARLAAS